MLLRERNAKWRLCTWRQHAIRHPLLAEWLVSCLSRRPSLTALFMAAVGDLIPARSDFWLDSSLERSRHRLGQRTFHSGPQPPQGPLQQTNSLDASQPLAFQLDTPGRL